MEEEYNMINNDEDYLISRTYTNYGGDNMDLDDEELQATREMNGADDEKFKLGDIIENPWAGHVDIKIGIYLGENKETYYLLENVNGKWQKKAFYKTSSINPQKWKKVGYTNMFEIGKNDLKKIKYEVTKE